jgi:hypothetical protein
MLRVLGRTFDALARISRATTIVGWCSPKIGCKLALLEATSCILRVLSHPSPQNYQVYVAGIFVGAISVTIRKEEALVSSPPKLVLSM